MTNCELCGEPMPAGEEIFKFHGYSGPCPKPPLPAEDGEESEERAWEYWQSRALEAESRLHEMRRALTINDVWPVVLKWLGDYQAEEDAFSRYADHVILDGIMTAKQRRAISAALNEKGS